MKTIKKKKQYRAIEFAQDVIKTEGMKENSDWINRIAERFKERFGKDEIDSLDFVDKWVERKLGMSSFFSNHQYKF